MSQSDSVSFTWEIEDFANWNTTGETSRYDFKQTKFWLELYPKGVVKNMNNHIAIYLLRVKPPQPINQKVMWTISLLNDKAEECYHKAIETIFINGFYAINGGLYHLDRNIIMDPSSGLLSDGKLTVKCTLGIFDCHNSVNINVDNRKSTQKKALENYQSILESSKFSDVVFVIGTKEFKLHKAILASQSPVFSAMFDSDLEEAKHNRVCITDVDVEVFEALIRFIYTANIDSVQQYALDLFVAADKYQLDSLKDICADSLCSNLSIDSVANILLVADMHSEAKLKSKCVQFINQHTTEVFLTEGWKHLIKSRQDLVIELYYHVTKFVNK